MVQKIGIILLDSHEIIIRIYEVNQKEWRLLQYQSTQLQTPENMNEEANVIIKSLAHFLASDTGSHVSEWRIAARGLSYPITKHIGSAIGMSIETIGPLREQELLCKGLFTELW